MSKYLNPRVYLRWLRRSLSDARQVASMPIHQRHRVDAAISWLRLDRRARRTKGPITAPFVNDAVLVWHPGSGSVKKTLFLGLGEPEEMAFTLHFLRSDDLFCDVGANAGVYTILATKVAGARGVAVEPVPTTFNMLQDNVAANGVGHRVTLHNSGAGSTPGMLHFTNYTTRPSYNHVAVEGGPDTITLPIRTLDEMLAGQVPRLLKVDVEGFEGEVVGGALKTLAAPALEAVIMELVPALEQYGTNRDAIVAQMASHGLHPVIYDYQRRRLTKRTEGFDLKHGGRYNTIFVRDMAAAQCRVEAAPTFRVGRGTV